MVNIIKKLKGSKTSLIGYSGFILCKWLFIAWGRHIHKQNTNMQTDFPEKVIETRCMLVPGLKSTV